MAATLTYTVFSLGEAQLHQIHTGLGKVSSKLLCTCPIPLLDLHNMFVSPPSTHTAICYGRSCSGVVPRKPYSLPTGDAGLMRCKHAA